MLAEIQRGITGSKLHAVRMVDHKVAPVREPEGAVNVGKEDVGRTLEGIVHTGLQRVLAHHKVPVILGLPGIHDAALGQVSSCANWGETGGLESHTGNCLLDLISSGNRAEAVAAKVHVQAVKAYTGFID